MASSVDLPVVTPPMMEKKRQSIVNLSVQQTSTQDYSKLQTMTLVVIDVGRRTISLLFSVHLTKMFIHCK